MSPCGAAAVALSFAHSNTLDYLSCSGAQTNTALTLLGSANFFQTVAFSILHGTIEEFKFLCPSTLGREKNQVWNGKGSRGVCIKSVTFC